MLLENRVSISTYVRTGYVHVRNFVRILYETFQWYISDFQTVCITVVVYFGRAAAGCLLNEIKLLDCSLW